MEQSNLEKLNQAWASAPTGAKSRLYEDYGYTAQNINDVLKKGRKDEGIILKILEDLKTVSRQITEDTVAQNKKLQAI